MAGLLHHTSEGERKGDGQGNREGGKFFWVAYQMLLTGTTSSAKRGENSGARSAKKTNLNQKRKKKPNLASRDRIAAVFIHRFQTLKPSRHYF